MTDTKIYLILFEDECTPGKKECFVSHGVGNNSLLTYCLPCEHPQYFNPMKDSQGLYIQI